METLTCPRCNEEKSRDDFYARSGRKEGTLQSYCKQCNNEAVMLRVAANKLRAIAYLGGRCLHCGYSRCPDALDFHHRDPSQKDTQPNRLLYRKWEKIVIELNKCDLLCSNCHREHHAGFALS